VRLRRSSTGVSHYGRRLQAISPEVHVRVQGVRAFRWVCSHVSAAAAILKDLGLTEAQSKTRARRRPGRPRRAAQCLVRDRINATEAEIERTDGPDPKLRGRLRQHPCDAIGFVVHPKFQTVMSKLKGEAETNIYMFCNSPKQATNLASRISGRWHGGTRDAESTDGGSDSRPGKFFHSTLTS
jgi:hypothetical protein